MRAFTTDREIAEICRSLQCDGHAGHPHARTDDVATSLPVITDKLVQRLSQRLLPDITASWAK
eukprot:11598976-Alexandrium_andersonii.AAC.1